MANKYIGYIYLLAALDIFNSRVNFHFPLMSWSRDLERSVTAVSMTIRTGDSWGVVYSGRNDIETRQQ